jgi:flagellar biosynthesis protein FlhF
MTTTNQSQIHVKSYFASNVPDAIEVAREELGADALFLNSRPAPPEALHLGAVEVVFGVYADKHPAEPPAAASAAPSAAPSSTSMEDLRQKIDEIRSLLIRPAAAPSSRNRVRLVEQALLDAGLTQAIATEIEEAVTARLNPCPVPEISRARKAPTRARKLHELDPDSIVRETIEEIESRLSVKPELGRITALVGPCGTGKTTTLVKLAVSEGLLKGRTVRLISADGERIGAAEQLRSYASILGASFESAEACAGLGQAIDRAAEDLILIDTPGLSPALFSSVGMDLARFLARRQDVDAHLVLTASTRHSDIEAAAKRFEVFHPSALIFTRLDETDSTGAVASEAIRSGKPVSWICAGQLIPEDIEAASKRRIAGALVHQLPGVLRSAA